MSTVRLRVVVRPRGHPVDIAPRRVTRAAYETESLSPRAIDAANRAAAARDADEDARRHVGLVSTREVRPVLSIAS